MAAPLSRAFAVLALVAGSAAAHEVQPAVADFEIAPDRIELSIEMTLEAPLAGVDLAGLDDTNAAENANVYDRLRALPPDDLTARVRAAWPDLSRKLDLRAGEDRLDPELLAVEVPKAGDVALARLSVLRIGADLPPGDAPIRIGWAPELGGLILRQVGIENGYEDYLTQGRLSEPIPRAGGSTRSAAGDFLRYIATGFDHIVPKGLDHILFVLGLFFLAAGMRALLWQVSAFTVAHTVTLALGATGVVSVPPAVVEPLIAASIAYVGVENVLSRGLTPWRPAVVFGFGLLHGLGFASVLTDFGLGERNFVAKLIGFNVGVELGQLAVIAAATLLLGWGAGRSWYRGAIATPASLLIAAVGLFWMVQRTVPA